MKSGAVPYWCCGGEVLTRALDATGRLIARPVATGEAHGLIAFYGDGPEASALRRAMARAGDWARAGGAAPQAAWATRIRSIGLIQ